jgi:hypothetical protein
MVAKRFHSLSRFIKYKPQAEAKFVLVGAGTVFHFGVDWPRENGAGLSLVWILGAA